MAMLMHGGVNYSGTTGSNTITLTQAEYDALPVEEKMDPEKVYYITDGVHTSTTVIPNPVTPATEDLNTLQIEETVYQIAGNGGSQAIETTLAAYEELPDEDKEDPNKVFYIKDVESNATFVRSPMIYSTSEAEVGVWTDGKPLYQKTLVFAGPYSGSSTSVSIGIENLDTVFIADGYAFDASNSVHPVPFVHSSTQYLGGVFINNEKTSIGIRLGTGITWHNIHLTLRYTKTTDVPGSGKYTESGAPAVHYSSDEQVIGTWIDGKTLYRKTLSISVGIACASNTWVDTGISVPVGISKVIHSIASANSACNASIIASCDNPTINIMNLRNASVTIVDFTIEYTKTTD